MQSGFLFWPVLLSLSGVLLALFALSADDRGWADVLVRDLPMLDVGREGARSVLGTIAGAMMTVISLVYSLTLLVFTLAAGNIAPRLLETFTDNRVNQITVGLLGATFLFSLLSLHGVNNVEKARLTVLIGMALATTSFFWLVYFVHDTARRIMVDNEIGRVQRGLRVAIDTLLAEKPGERDEDSDTLPDGDGTPLLAEKSGYITAIHLDQLLSLARARDGFIRMFVAPGRFVVSGEAMATTYGLADSDERALRRGIVVSDARAPEGDIQFSIHLNVEVALKALSPGLNDAYTAVSAIDHLSASLARILRRGTPSALIRDDGDVPRIWCRTITLKEIVGTALHPLRRAARDNLLVTLKLIEAIGRMAKVADPAHVGILHRHLRLIAEDMARTVRTRDDRRELAEHLALAHRDIWQTANRKG